MQRDMNKNSQIPIPINDLSARRVSGSPHNNSSTTPPKNCRPARAGPSPHDVHFNKPPP